jgi:hypothetical protein
MSLLDDENILINNCVKTSHIETIRYLLKHSQFDECIKFLNDNYKILDGYFWKIDYIGDPIYTNNKNWICSIYIDSEELILEFDYKDDDINNPYITSKFDYEKILKEFNINISTIKSYYVFDSF